MFINYHTPVLIDKIIEFVPQNIDSANNLLVDACFGEGGYTDRFLSRFKNLNILGIEQDSEIYNIVKEKYKNEKRVLIKNGNFVKIDEFVNEEFVKDKRLKFVVFDLGISMFHIKASTKGISFNKELRLDMRLNPDASESAYDIINYYKKEDLADLFYNYADERMSKQIAHAIVEFRKTKKIETTSELVKIISSVKKDRRKNPATKVFQALRIKVNNEFENLKNALEKIIPFLDQDGRVAIVSYHSGEDRIVKNFIKNRIDLRPIFKKPIIPDYSEMSINPSARSAKLRIFEKI